MKTPKRIDSKILGAGKETILEMVMKDKKKSIPLYNVVGAAFKASVEDSANGMGEYIELKGEFKGISLITGEEMISSCAILPNVAGTMIAGQLMVNQMNNDEKEKKAQPYVEISLTITAQYDKDSATSYIFGVEIHNERVDAFKKLETLIPKNLLPKATK